MASIFLSYSRESKPIAITLAADIEALGHTVWFDQEISGGRAWWDEILAQVRACDVFVFVLNPETLGSAACKSEYSYAADLGKSILPVLVSEQVSTNLLPPALSQIQFVDFRQQDHDAALRLAKALYSIPPPGPSPNPLPAPPEAPISYLGSLTELVESTSTLSYEEQRVLVADLRRGLRDPETTDPTQKLLAMLRKRQDLFATFAQDIDDLLANIRKPIPLPSHSFLRASNSATRLAVVRWIRLRSHHKQVITLVALALILVVVVVVYWDKSRPGLTETSPPQPPVVETPSKEVAEAIRQALLQMDAKISYTYYGSPTVTDNNSRAIFFELNQKWQDKALLGLIYLLTRSGDSTERFKATKLVEYYLREPSVRELKEKMMSALNYGLSAERDPGTQNFLITVIKESPTTSEDKFQRLHYHLRTTQDGSVRAYLIRVLGELAPLKQRDNLAVELVQIISNTQNEVAASAAADVIKQFGYRKANPDLMDAVQKAPPGVAAKIAGLLRSLTSQDESQREQLAALMTDMMSRTQDASLAWEAATTIKEFNYEKAGPVLTPLLCTTTNSSVASSAADVIKTLRYEEACQPLREALLTVPLDVADDIADVLAEFQDKEAIKPLRSRIQTDRNASSGSLVSLGRSLYRLQGEQSTDMLIQIFKEGQSSLQTGWISLFKEYKITKAREAVKQVKESTTSDYVQKTIDEYLKAVGAL